MKVRTKLRRVRRLAVLGAVTGTVVGVQRSRAQRSAAKVGSPATWPPLERSDDAPTASVGDLARAAATVADVPVPTADAVAEGAVADLADDVTGELITDDGDPAADVPTTPEEPS